MLTSLPVIDDYAEMLEDLIDNSDKCKKEEIIEAYNSGVTRRKETRFATSLKTLDQMESVTSQLPWKPSKKSEITIENLESTNPKKACKAIVKEKQRQITDNKKFINIYKGALIAALEIQEKGMSVDEFVEKLPNPHFTIFNSKTKNNYLNLKHFIKRTFLANLKLTSITEFQLKVNNMEINWTEIINNAVSFLNDNNEMAKMNLQELGFSGKDEPNCSKLPNTALLEQHKTTVMDTFAGGWSALKYVGKCLINSLENIEQEYIKGYLKDLVKELGIGFLKKLLIVFASTSLNMLAFFSSKAVKILWWLIKAGYYIYKAIDKEKTKYRYWGKAVGAGIRVIYIAFMPTERKK